MPSVFHLLRDARMHRKVFRAFSTTQMTVTLTASRRRGRIAVACDGEVLQLMLPLVYCSLPRALKVIVPEPIALARSQALQTP
jgi:diacylglycerol kinase family enzyme